MPAASSASAATHTYTGLGFVNGTVTIVDAGGSQVTTTFSVDVIAAPVYSVASFHDSNPNDPASSFSAVINWGDGTPTTSGTITGSAGNFSVTGTHSYAEASKTPYNVSVTITGPGGQTTAQSTAQVGDAPLAAAQAPPAPLAPPAPVAQVPTVKFNFVPGGGVFSDLINGIAAVSPGLRIHVDDSFYEEVVDPADPTKNTLLADNLLNGINPAVDQNLIQGTITIGPANSQGMLSWNFPNSVRVWWQPVQGGPWSLVNPKGNPANFKYPATGRAIPIAIQSLRPDSNHITVTYTIAGPNPPASQTIYFTGYTGLNVSGVATGKNPPVLNFLGQLGAATGYTFATDSTGNVWRNTELWAAPQYMETAAGYLADIMNNSFYRSYQSQTATTTVTAVAGNTPGIFDSLTGGTFYPDNIASVITAFGKDGPKFGAAVIIHGLEEQYLTQVRRLAPKTNPTAKNDDQVGGAIGAGVTAEEAILQWGTRVQKKDEMAVIGGQAQITKSWDYSDANNRVTYVGITYVDDLTMKYISAQLIRPKAN